MEAISHRNGLDKQNFAKKCNLRHIRAHTRLWVALFNQCANAYLLVKWTAGMAVVFQADFASIMFP